MQTDSLLQHNVLDELEWEPSVESAHIGVTANEGVVTLTGHVPSLDQKMSAEHAAKRVKGAKAVANDIEVRVPGSCRRTDDDLAAAAVSAIQWYSSAPDEKIKLTVRDGLIVMEGEVDWYYQKAGAEQAVRYLTGVRGVSNLITVKPRIKAKPHDVKNLIEAAFKRSAELDARRVGVDVVGGKVTLHGHVRSWDECDQAIRAAWSAPGVSDVVNHLEVIT